MKHEQSRALYDYWDGVRGTRPAPRRLEIEPGAIASILPNVFILERLDPVSYRFRLAGTHLCGFCGHELRDRLFTTLWPTDEREAIESLLYSVTEDACGVVAGLEGTERGGRVANFELLLLPLMTMRGAYDRIIGSISAINSPYWLGSWPIVGFGFKSSRILWPDGHPPVLVEDDPIASHAHASALRSSLKVIDGGLARRSE